MVYVANAVPKRHDDKQSVFDLWVAFKQFRESLDYIGTIDFLNKTFSNNIKNKTFNFNGTGHLFHSFYAYVPQLNNSKERKQIRLTYACISKLYQSTKNDFNLYTELFQLLDNSTICPCQILLKRQNEIINYINELDSKTFDAKPPKLLKNNIDNILYKYSLNWKSTLLKKRGHINVHVKKKKKISLQKSFNNKPLHFGNKCTSLQIINGMTLVECNHVFRCVEKQTRSGDELVSFINVCMFCNLSKVV